MGKTIYDKAIESLSYYRQIVVELSNIKSSDYIDLTFKLDENKTTSEFDLLKKEFPDTNRKYLQQLLDGYIVIDRVHDSLYDPKNYNHDFTYLAHCLKNIIHHLNQLLYFENEDQKTFQMLNPETKIQEPSKPITTPKGQTKLTREQTALLFWY